MACQRRPAANAKMLCVRAGRPWQIEIGTGQKVGDYSLTLAFKTAWSTEVIRLLPRAVVLPLEYLSSDRSSWRGHVVQTPAAVDRSAPVTDSARVTQPMCAADQLSEHRYEDQACTHHL